MEDRLKHRGNGISSHDYEVKRLHFDGSTFDAVVFYLRAGEPVRIDLEAVLRATNLWTDPTTSNPEADHHLVFEVAPQTPDGTAEVYISKYTATMSEGTHSEPDA